MKLEKYIRFVGDAELAALLGVSARTVGSWRRGDSFPARPRFARIDAATDGVVAEEDLERGRRLWERCRRA